ncbi:MAG TPA: helix-turn-helix domain-containing protein [Polyangiaceae bacterium]
MAARRDSAPKLLASEDNLPRRGRPPVIDSARLLAVAREVFLERGIRATTLEVAERAGVSEGSLFNRFKSKEGLFAAAMNFDAEEAGRLLQGAIRDIEGLEVREGLTQLSTTLLGIGRIALPIMMMSWSNPKPSGETSFDKKRAGFSAFLKACAAYLEGKMEEGKLRHIDAELLARTLIGSLHHYSMTRTLMEADEVLIPEGMFVRGLVDLLLNGASCEGESVSVRRLPLQKPRTSGE